MVKYIDVANFIAQTKQIRISQGMTLTDLSIQTKIPVHILENFENNGCMPGFFNLGNVAKALKMKVKVEWL